MVLDCTGSVKGGTGWHLMVMGQYGAVLVGTWWYWVSMGRYWLVLNQRYFDMYEIPLIQCGSLILTIVAERFFGKLPFFCWHQDFLIY